MRISPGLLLRRALVGCSALATVLAPGCPATAAPSAAEAESVNFTQRYRALQHGGIVRAANSSISCRTTVTRAAAPSCSAARAGGQAAVNSDFDMFYVDVDKDPNTYNSSLGEVRLPQGARVTYARLYWGGNLRVGEQKPPKDNGRVLFAEPDGEYKAVLADTVVGHRVARGADAFQASADVTKLVRASGSGLYTVAQVNVAMGRSAAGAWGGWTLMVAYEKESEPLRHLAMWDGFDSLGPREDQVIRLRGLRFPAGAGGRAGLVAYNGDRGSRGDSLTVSTGRGGPTALGDGANPRDDVLNSTISEPASAAMKRVPAYPNTLGYDSDVLELGKGIRRGGDQLTFRLVSQRDAAWVGALFTAVDAKQ
ncbi:MULTISPECIES: DUF3344 domain-containing protein [unclassified Streptomyces]|uniref:DUF3344 domain-containing protein n=1 Tax=unclassified Streptomyces TaxID=2593676 RepID=UPI002250E209|nr:MULTISPECIES: DUF3344 domain-containing protein [unclassified Streptomyces]MCX4974388.1 DUF3344 domain-containing protein [Streptomyces sp. NBC_00620]WTB41042.1 DUF3344 domain-containing protein [Streptomyces sp. NBC_00827]